MGNIVNKPAPRSAEKGVLWKLFWSFLRIGGFTFGGGWAMISLIEREVVDNRQWIGREEFLDLLAVAQSLPGVMAVNVAVAVGDRLRGMRGSVCAALGNILPSFLIILTVAVFLTPDLIKNNEVVSAIFQGIRPAVVALIIAPMVTSAQAAKLGWKTLWIPVVVALLIWSKWPVVSNPILYIVLGGLLGWVVLSHVEQRRPKKGAEDDDLV
ncbi:MAG: chromate transporter [[Clostridium] fimetarium]|nr:chromate transporter [Alistipes timonensis]MCM1405905.1 chromate transporter [[Clostridium] fimetarium]